MFLWFEKVPYTRCAMSKCIYCLKEKSSQDFSVEHVIPRQLGIFDHAPTLVGCVCAACNRLFSRELENNLAESTHEGQYAKKIEVGKPSSLRASSGFERVLTGEDENADHIKWHLQFKRRDGVLIAEPTSGIVLISSQGKKNRVPLNALIEAEKRMTGTQKKEFAKYRELVARAKTTQFFISAEDCTDKTWCLLKEYGLDAGRMDPRIISGSARTLFLEERHTGGRKEIRAFAKIAFNYFAKVMEESGLIGVVYDGSFERIKRFILGDESIPMAEICANPGIIEVDNSKLEVIEIETKSHSIQGIEVRLQISGGAVFRIRIGKRPEEMSKIDFKVGHIFFPSERRFARVPPKAGSPTFSFL